MKNTDKLQANFEPSETRLLKTHTNSQLLLENPILSSALSRIFPYLLLMDNLLEIITWTNDDPYQNFLLLIAYSIVVLYWGVLKYVIVPFIGVVGFSYIIWLINSVVYDTKFDEQPTIDEIIKTVHNITVRFEILHRPISSKHLKWRNYFHILTAAAILTPVYGLAVKFLTVQKVVWLLGLYVLSYHSQWSFAIRRLLWRSVYVRIAAYYLTGAEIKLSIANTETVLTNDKILSDFTVINKKIVSPTQLEQTILFEVLENERRWIGLGWSKILYPSERNSYCFEQSLLPVLELKDFQFPQFEGDLYAYDWKWFDSDWKIDPEFNKSKPDGWKYYDSSWENEGYEDAMSKYTRSRKWIRTATLVIDKKTHVYDQ